MNDLHKAYNVLGLEPGTSLEAILRRYKRLIMVWHPDRFPTEDGKKDAEEELKKINNAKDKLKDHFDKGGHKASGPCTCRADQAQAHGARSQTEDRSGERSTGPGQRRKSSEERQREEEAAKRRSEERRRQEEAEAKRKADEHAKAQAEASQQQAFEQAMKYEEQHKYDALCWKISLACGGIFILLMVIALAADGIEDMIVNAENAIFGLHESTQDSAKHSDDWSKYIDDRQRVASQILGQTVSMNDILDWRPPYSDPNGSPLQRAIYQRLTPPTPPPSVNPPSLFNLWGNTSTNTSGNGNQPNIDIHPTLSPNELRTRIAENQSKLDQIKNEINVRRLSGNLSQDQESDLDRQMNGLTQQIDIDQTYLKSAETSQPMTNTGNSGLNWLYTPEKKSFFNSTPAPSDLSKPSLSEQLKQILDKYKTPSSTDK